MMQFSNSEKYAVSECLMNYLSPVGEPDGLDLVGEAGVGQRIDPSVDESLLPAHIHIHRYSVKQI
jgi:hypothetical protein